MGKRIRIGCRDSVLAVKQAQIVMGAVRDPSIEFELVLIKTTGDKALDRNLDEIGGKGLFIKELELALIDGGIDIAVHSYKDMPYDETDGLPVVAVSKREAPFDALVLPEGVAEIDRGKPVGSSSLRRTIQFNRLYDGFEVKPIRGNVPTRLSKLELGEYSALILAQAGLIRLGLGHRVALVFTLDEMIPSGSQGIIAVQGRQGEDYSFLDSFHCQESEIVSKAERRFLKTLSGGCTSPVAVYGELIGRKLMLTGMYVDGSGNVETGRVSGDASNAESLGEALSTLIRGDCNLRQDNSLAN